MPATSAPGGPYCLANSAALSKAACISGSMRGSTVASVIAISLYGCGRAIISSRQVLRQNPGESRMKRITSLVALGLLVGAAPASAKIGSCDEPIVWGTTVSATGVYSTLADRWKEMT